MESELRPTEKRIYTRLTRSRSDGLPGAPTGFCESRRQVSSTPKSLLRS